MAQMNLPTHPTMRHPLSGEPLQALYVDGRGRARYPIMGGSGEGGDDNGAGSGDNGGDSGTGSGSDGGNGAGRQGGDKGFPENTPLEQMTAEQRESYWKDKAHKHENRVKSLGGLTPDELATLREKANQHDALERELMSDKDKAVLEAREAAVADARAQYAPQLVEAKFEAVAAKRIDPERLATLLEDIDLTKYLTDDGSVDAERVAKKVDAWAPATDEGDGQQQRRGPSPTGAGRRSSSTGPSLQSGAELYQSRKRRG